MMKLFFNIALLLISALTFAQFPDNVLSLEMGVNAIEEMEVNLIKGETFPNSFFKTGLGTCWNTKDKTILNGKHILYAIKVPPHAEITITAAADIDISMYGYMMDKNNFIVPPKFPKSGIIQNCQTSFKKQNVYEDPEKLVFATSDLSKNLVIGICGTNGISLGDISVRFKMKSLTTGLNKPSVYKIRAIKNQKTAYRGDLSNGTLMPLDWATTSETNCFSQNQFSEFDGNHIYYIMNLPAKSVANVMVHSLSDSKINIFGFTGHDGVSLPPNINKTKSCLASFSNFDNKSKQNLTFVSRQADKVLFAVAGANGANSGKYHIIVELNDME